MSNLQDWENKIKEVRMITPFRDFVREITSWNPMVLYKHGNIISRYPDSDRYQSVYDNKTYSQEHSEKEWIEYDFSKNFFANWKNLWNITPKSAILHLYWNNENSEYADAAFWTKNCYLSFVLGMDVENVLYSMFVYINSKNIFNSVFCSNNSENIYFWLSIDNCFNIFYSKFLKNSNNIWFSTNLIWCSECIFCDNLQSQKYCINNKNFEKEEYMRMKKEILENKEKFSDYFDNLNNKWLNLNSENVTWIWIVESVNITAWAIVSNIENWRNLLFVSGLPYWKNFYDCMDAWANSFDIYWAKACWDNVSNIYCSWEVGNSSNIYYSYNLNNCSFCLGCIWLKNKSYCILNKEYSKEKWLEIVDKIFAQMEKDWILWKFFTWDINPFYFNDTAACLIYNNFTKEEVTDLGYLWRDEEIKVDIPEWFNIIESKDIDINNYDESILKKIIKDHKWNSYKIVALELEFLKKYNLPLPKTHWLERIKLGFNF